MSERTILSIPDATGLSRSVLAAAGVAEQVAASVATALVAAEAEGQAGYGFSRLGDDVAQVRSGRINAAAQIRTHFRGPSSDLIDADCVFAFPALETALAAGLPRTEETGVVIMAVANSQHCGALSMQVEKIAHAGLIGIMLANAPKAIAPWGAREPYFGTNPIALATPRAQGDPLVIDLSPSKVARGKVMNARKSNQPIPPGRALDAEGKPTTLSALAICSRGSRRWKAPACPERAAVTRSAKAEPTACPGRPTLSPSRGSLPMARETTLGGTARQRAAESLP